MRDKYRDLIEAVQDQTGTGEEGATADCIHDMVKKANEAFHQGNYIIYFDKYFKYFNNLLLVTESITKN